VSCLNRLLKRCATAQDGAETGQVELPGLRTLAEHDSDGWGEEEVADLELGDARGAELRNDYDRGVAVQLKEQVAKRSADVWL
jgi:hypothetical protein